MASTSGQKKRTAARLPGAGRSACSMPGSPFRNAVDTKKSRTGPSANTRQRPVRRLIVRRPSFLQKAGFVAEHVNDDDLDQKQEHRRPVDDPDHDRNDAED